MPGYEFWEMAAFRMHMFRQRMFVLGALMSCPTDLLYVILVEHWIVWKNAFIFNAADSLYFNEYLPESA